VTQIATIVPLSSTPSAVEPAVVKGKSDSKGVMPVVLQSGHESQARIALYPQPRLAPGDEVLILQDRNGGSYIVGILSCRSDPTTATKNIRLADGSKVLIDRSNDQESLKLFSEKNELLIDYQTHSGVMKVNAASGSLEFTAPEGDITFRSAGEIQLDGEHVAVKARSDLDVGIQDSSGGPGPALRMQRYSMKLAAPVFDLTAQRTKLFLEETYIAGRKLLGKISGVQLVSRKIESVADTVTAKAKNVYRTISELSQLKAGRQRTLVEKTSHMKARKTILKSEKDFKVKAEKIHLG
jgi:hypothetical protein